MKNNQTQAFFTFTSILEDILFCREIMGLYFESNYLKNQRIMLANNKDSL